MPAATGFRAIRAGRIAGALLAAWAISLACLSLSAAPGQITVQVDQPGHRISPTLWGIFFEDINCSADGGIYAEMVRNRSFEDAEQPEHWSLVSSGSGVATMAVVKDEPISQVSSNRNRQTLRLQVVKASRSAPIGISNEGFWGMSVQQGKKYELSFYARCDSAFRGPVAVQLQKPGGAVCASGEVTGLKGEWKKFKVTLTAKATEPAARLVLTVANPGTIWFDMVSLFPQETWKGRGLRTDLMEKLDALQPAFVRFPGGCWVEGDTMALAYRWKETVGDISQRRTQYNIWQYHATHGVGFHEYLQMCEDLGAEPLFVINCGMSHKENIPMDQMQPFVQDALDAIEYCNGPVTSHYGALRAKNGHPAPFHLKYMEIGNENGGPAYAERWALFHKAIKAVHPEMQLIADQWDGGHPTNFTPDIVDEHYYSTPEFFIQRAGMYDSYDRKGPKIYVGEYAVTQGCGQGNLRAALGEAVFMMGMERNSDIVAMASYAPLFANVNYKKWNPDLICYDNSQAYGLPSYYVQKLFSKFRGDVVLPVKVNSPVSETAPLKGTVGVGTWSTAAEFKDMKVVSDGRTVYEWNPAGAANQFKTYGGEWLVVDGALRQSSLNENVRAMVPSRVFTNYTYSLKARKLSGNEGFLVLFNVADPEAKSWWNVGGWANDHHALEIGSVVGNEKKGSVETNRWYDLRIEVAGKSVKCYLDGELTCEGTVPESKSLHANATRTAAGDVIIKVVNVAAEAIETDLQFDGISKLSRSVETTVLTSESGEDENSLAQPEKIVPRHATLMAGANGLHHSFPGNSLTILRLKKD